MSLSPGTRLGAYEILAPIGKGGMGEVFQARDSRLGREVAIKVSGEQFTDRFQREAQAIASLNHPNICTLYDVGPNYLVMDLIGGQTLAERIKQGAIPLEEALAIAKQIAAALEAAHEKGIVHRDLKPGNVKVTPEGTVKVLDFGLAKVGGTPTANSGDSPTITMGATQFGMILGTAAYMAPEQARGRPVDKRADIWAFGVVLHEMLTGQQLFQGDDLTDTLAAVLRHDPDWERVPVQVRRLLKRCLEKDPKKRLRDIGDWMLLMDEAPVAYQGEVALPPTSRPWPWIAAAAAFLLTTLGFGIVAFQHNSEEAPRVVRLSAEAPEKSTYAVSGPPAVSPDGRHVAFSSVVDGKTMVWVRDLDSLTSRPLTGTDGGIYPFWSPDSRFIGFFTATNLKKIELAGGPAVTICGGIMLGRGGSWNANGVIVFAPNATGGLFRVSAAGGTATPLTKPDESLKETVHWYPWFLPDGQHFLYTATSREDPEQTSIYVADVDAKDESRSRRKVLTANSEGVYTPLLRSQSEGYLLFLREQTLMAQPFDASKFQTTGDAVPIAEQVDHATGSTNGRFGTSDNGVLAYYTGAASGGVSQLTWLDRSGKATGTVGEPGAVAMPSISPDGTAVAFSRLDPKTGTADIWIRDLARGTDSRFTFGPRNSTSPIWSPDGKALAFLSNRDGTQKLYQKATTGTGQDQALDQDHGSPMDWSRDGRYIIESAVGAGGGQLGAKGASDIWVLPLFGDRKAFPYLQTEFTEYDGKLSPDGRWLAYTSNETTRPEVYVMSFPTPGGKWQVSTTGGSTPVWSRDGRELYFRAPDGKIMAASVGNDGAKFEAGVPKELFTTRSGLRQYVYFDVSRDGKFLLAIPAGSDAPTPPINVVLNWQAGLRK